MFDPDGEASDLEDGHETIWHGKRKCHLFKCDGFYFVKDKFYESTGETHFKCKEYGPRTQKGYNCGARAKRYLNGPIEQHYGQHNHPVNPHYAEYLLKRKELVDLCLAQSYRRSALQIYKDFVTGIENRTVAGMFSAKSIFAAVSYQRSKNRPKMPQTFEAVNDCLEHPDFSYLGRTKDDKDQFYQGMVGKEGEESLVFASPRALKMVHTTDTVASDQTYKITPKLLGGYQVMIFALLAFGHAFQIATVIMKSKSERAYKDVILKMKSLGLKPKQAITDWELAERNAWRKTYPGMKVLGCVWHFIRALHKHAKSLGLKAFWSFAKRDDEDPTSHFLRLCCLLPRLPGTAIKEGYRYVRGLVDELQDETRVKAFEFVTYLNQQWIKNKTKAQLEELSVFGHGVATTSGLESINRKLNTEVRDAHPNIWKFLELIKEQEQNSIMQYKHILSKGKSFTASRVERRPKRSVQWDADIAVAKANWGKTKCVKEFLNFSQPTLQEAFETLDMFPDDEPIRPLDFILDEDNQDLQNMCQLEDSNPDDDLMERDTEVQEVNEDRVLVLTSGAAESDAESIPSYDAAPDTELYLDVEEEELVLMNPAQDFDEWTAQQDKDLNNLRENLRMGEEADGGEDESGDGGADARIESKKEKRIRISKERSKLKRKKKVEEERQAKIARKAANQQNEEQQEIVKRPKTKQQEKAAERKKARRQRSKQERQARKTTV